MPTRPPVHRNPHTANKPKSRPSVTARGYGTQQWKDLRLEAIRLGGWKCEICNGPIKRGHGGMKGDKVDVDHRERATPDMPSFWDIKNLRVTHHACHSSKTCSIDGGFGNPKRKANVL